MSFPTIKEAAGAALQDVSDSTFRGRLQSFLESDIANPTVTQEDYLRAEEILADALEKADARPAPDQKPRLERLFHLWEALRAHPGPKDPANANRVHADFLRLKPLIEKWGKMQAESK